MRARPAASLTATLLFRKGNASPNGFSTRPPPASASVAALGDGRDEEPGGGRPRRSRTEKGAARLSVRLAPEQHRRLRIVAAHTRQSIQAAIMTALDRYIGEVAPVLIKGGCRCLSRPPGALQPFDVSNPCCDAASPRRKEGTP